MHTLITFWHYSHMSFNLKVAHSKSLFETWLLSLRQQRNFKVRGIRTVYGCLC